jgi:hypothetical protein
MNPYQAKQLAVTVRGSCHPAQHDSICAESHVLRTEGRVNIRRIAFWFMLTALAFSVVSVRAKNLSSVNMKGDRQFDSDSIVFQGTPERRWLSYPGGRLCVNPATSDEAVTNTSDDLALDLGGYVGTEVVKLPKVLRVGLVEASNPEAPMQWSTSRATTWFPYKLGLSAEYPGGIQVSGFDAFINKDSTLIRTLEVNGGLGRLLCLTGEAGSGQRLEWDADARVLLVSGKNYYYALRFVRLTGKTMKTRDVEQSPSITSPAWRLQLPLESQTERYGISLGFATAQEGRAVAITRAQQAFKRPVASSVADAKLNMDRFLRQVPLPKAFGFAAVASHGVTPEIHRQSYYMAWAFLYQSLIQVMPENPDYPYPQMSLGKGALWDGGEHTSPATCGWESFLGIQWLSFIDPVTAWNAYEGIMSRVDAQGRLGGESLPSRKAQTAWILFQQKPDKKRLAAVYPSIKRYLLWREANPRWIWGDNLHNMPDEKDLEFVASWILDVEYAAQIAQTLNLPDEVAFWRGKVPPMIENMRQWFFSDPQELHQYYFVNTGKYAVKDRDEVRPVMILSALAVPNLPPDMVARLSKLFMQTHKPGSDNDGFDYLKYPDNNFLAYGLIDQGMPTQAREFVEAVARDCIRGGEFAEVLDAHDGRDVKSGGVKPSLFTALNLIEFTWLMNGVRYDSGHPVEYQFGTENH